MARQLGLPYLGELPMFTELRVNSDAGNPTAKASLRRFYDKVQAVKAERMAKQL